jgi:hypothetical protein
MGRELEELWVEGVRIIERARDHIENRMAYAWAAHLSRYVGGIGEVGGRQYVIANRVRRDLVDDIIYPALEMGDGAEAELMKRLNNPAYAQRMTLRHRQHIVEGTKLFVTFIKFARNTYQSEQDVRQLIADWRVPPSAYPNDVWVFNDNDARTGQIYYRGMRKFEEKLKEVPTLQDRLSAPEKMVYVQYLGEWKQGKIRLTAPGPLGNRALKAVLIKVGQEEQYARDQAASMRQKAPEPTPPAVAPEATPLAPAASAEPARPLSPAPAPEPRRLPPPAAPEEQGPSDAEVQAALERLERLRRGE